MTERHEQPIHDEELVLLAAGELPEARRAAVVAAVESSRELARRLAVYRYLLEKPRHLPTERPSEQVLSRLAAAARQQAPKSAGLWESLRAAFTPRRLAWTTALAAGLAAVAWVGHEYTTRPTLSPSAALTEADIDSGLDAVESALAALDNSSDASAADEGSSALWTANASDLDAGIDALQESLDDLSLDMETASSSHTNRG